MLTQEQITYIMTELGLDTNDQALRNTIEQIAASKPTVNIDARFIASLRDDLAHKAQTSQFKFKKQNNYFSYFMNKILVSALVVCIALVAGGVWYIQHTNKPLINTSQLGDTQVLSGKYAIKSVGTESFGDLAKAVVSNNGQGGGGSPEASDSLNNTQGTAQGGTKVAAPNTPIGMGGGVGTAPAPDSLIYRPTNYTFKYTGGDLPTLADTQSVLKRVQPDQPQSFVSRVLSFLSFGLIDTSKFTDTKLQSFSFMEDHDFGYGLSVDMQNGSMSVYQNWQKWPQPYNCVGGDACPAVQPVKITDLPSDTDAIAMANQFLSDYGVSREGYGEPVIDDTWRIQYQNAKDKTSFYIPEQIQVIYPLQLEGKNVLDESGYRSGMIVFIDVRNKKVSSLSDLNTKQFESSAYTGETNSKRLLDVAARGGFRNYLYNDPNGKKQELDLDTPTIDLIRMWYSTDNYKTTNELYVPSLVFPIKNWAETGYWRHNVIVPIVTSILDSDKQFPGGQPIPLDSVTNTPAVKPSGTSGIVIPDSQGGE